MVPRDNLPTDRLIIRIPITLPKRKLGPKEKHKVSSNVEGNEKCTVRGGVGVQMSLKGKTPTETAGGKERGHASPVRIEAQTKIS